MPRAEVYQYVLSQLRGGVSRERVIEHLKTGGWTDQDIQEIMHEVDKDPHLVRPAFSDLMEEGNKKKHPVLLTLLLIVVVFVVFFILFSVLFNEGFFGPPDLLVPPIQTSQIGEINPLATSTTSTTSLVTDSQASATSSVSSAPISNSTPAQSPAVQPVVKPPVKPVNSIPVSADDEDQIISAILTQNTVFGSGNATAIRNYLTITASPSYADTLASMSDSIILNLAQNMLVGSQYVSADSLIKPSTVWKLIGSSSVQITILAADGSSVVRKSSEVGGVWY